MKLKNVVIATIAFLAISCSTDESQEIVTTSKNENTVLSKERGITQDFHAYTQLLKDLYGASNYKIENNVTYNQKDQSFKIAKVVNKHHANVIYGYFVEEVNNNKLYYVQDNSETKIITKYSIEKLDNYTSQSYDVKNNSYYLTNGLNPDATSKVGPKFWGWVIGYEECIDGFQVVYKQYYIFGIPVNDRVYFFDDENSDNPLMVPCS